jgi:hypothetical protein
VRQAAVKPECRAENLKRRLCDHRVSLFTRTFVRYNEDGGKIYIIAGSELLETSVARTEINSKYGSRKSE